jgi:dTDP-4-dehydrorhamnose 3,5-epimerase-like enzyme
MKRIFKIAHFDERQKAIETINKSIHDFLNMSQDPESAKLNNYYLGLKDAMIILKDESIPLNLIADMFRINGSKNPGMEKAYSILSRTNDTSIFKK